MSVAAADRVLCLHANKQSLNAIAATGNTPMGLYRELAARYRVGRLNTSRMRVFQLDAYIGLGADDKRSLYR